MKKQVQCSLIFLSYFFATVGASSFPPSMPFDLDELMSGPLDDAKCNIEAVDMANNVQLACILSDLMDTTFFRLFTVDLERKCPFFQKSELPKAPETCSGGGPDPMPFSFGGGDGFSEDQPPKPACSLEGASGANEPPFAGSGSKLPLSSATKRRKIEPFAAPTDEVDQSLSNKENEALENSRAKQCDDENLPTFWLDMCDGIGVTGKDRKTVNLRKNPERWTGYNGSQVWQAIYQENFLATNRNSSTKKQKDDLVYEERLLYKLLSAMHTSINVHIALDHYPPRKGKRTRWEPNPAHFVDRYADHPDRIKNLHFGFVVLLRAVRKAGPQLLEMDYRTDILANASSPEGTGRHTRALVERLLQTDMLASCNEVFGAFDESLLFQSNRDGTPVAQLKRHFKQVFRNISRVLDCVSCQKCKLHGKLSLLGLGTALKTLLLPAPLLKEGLRREEVVALINTLGKFSKAIQGARDLTMMYRKKLNSLLLKQPKGGAKKGVGVADIPSKKSSRGNAKIKPEPLHQQEVREAGLKGSNGFFLSSFLPSSSSSSSSSSSQYALQGGYAGAVSAADAAVAMIAQLSSGNNKKDEPIGGGGGREVKKLTQDEEDLLLDSALGFDPRVLILARHYSSSSSPSSSSSSSSSFARHALRVIRNLPPPIAATFGSAASTTSPRRPVGGKEEIVYDLIVVGGGLTGLTAALTVLDGGGSVAIVEKEPFLGGNSAWASSGVNAAPPQYDDGEEAESSSQNEDNGSVDSIARFARDTLKSGNGDEGLVAALASGSMSAVKWMEKRLDIELDKVAQLGGHSVARTRRSKGGMIGQELVTRIARIVKTFAADFKNGDGAAAAGAGNRGVPLFRLLTRATATRIVLGEAEDASPPLGGVNILHYSLADKTRKKQANSTTTTTIQGTLKGRYIAVTTGGYANDRRSHGLLYSNRPDLQGFPTTNGRWATGDGIGLATAVGADTVDMQQVQVHPTAFVDLDHPTAARKTLCAELLRGVGGILLKRTYTTNRFVDELAPRDEIVARMKSAAAESGSPSFVILLSEAMSQAAGKHAEHYLKKALLRRFESIEDVATWGNMSTAALKQTLTEYNRHAAAGGAGPHGKRFFHNTPIDTEGGFVAGVVVPAIHYTMGGLRIAPNASVIAKSGAEIKGLLAGGEVTGGMHGKNRLGGNALTECVVFGRTIGQRVLQEKDEWRKEEEEEEEEEESERDAPSLEGAAGLSSSGITLKNVSSSELSKHASAEDCWVALFGKVYDFTDFVNEHPAGPEAILRSAGKDGTEEFEAIHAKSMLDDFDPIGILR